MRHTSDTIKIDYIVMAILRYQDQIVTVRQHIAKTNQSCWVLPGGLVESGEMITDALIREVEEEAGVQVKAIERMVGLSQIDRPLQAIQTLFFLFEISQWQGMLQCQDPDGEAHKVELVQQGKVVNRLERNGAWPEIKQPLVSYLRGEVHPGTIWFYREEHGKQQLLAMLPPAYGAE